MFLTMERDLVQQELGVKWFHLTAINLEMQFSFAISFGWTS
jgi:hypothetical protein